ncbi:MAG: CrcB family protein [Phycisphaerae bacterium]|nr:CrcB family protein [Phycisphaerae bacterium]
MTGPALRLPPVLVVAVGGGLGSVARVGLFEAIGDALPPWTILTLVNLLGSIAAGALWVRLRQRDPATGRASARLVASAFLITGFLGGFTTFSGFGLYTATLAGRGLTNDAIVVFWLGLVIAVFGASIGVALARPVAARSQE